ncbi:DUF4097 family beta strand repeat protein [bacterium]|nr:DUF4097 family beta strand repeat protein [bacterium]
MKRGMSIIISIIILLLSWNYSIAGEQKEIHKRFDGKKSIDLQTVSGDCAVKTHNSDEIIVDVAYDEKLEGVVEFKFRETSKKLIIEEDWRKNSRNGGNILWTLTVPKETIIEFSTASGDLNASGLSKGLESNTASGDIEIEDVNGKIDISVASGDINIVNCAGEIDISTASGDIDITNSRGEIEISTASGDIYIENSKGDIDLSTASGDIKAVNIDNDEIEFSTASGKIEISNSRGAFDLSCASGEIKANDVTIEGSSDFSTASGDIKVILAEASEYDLELSAASGNVLLDYNSNPIKGYFKFEAKKRGGRIKCPFDFEHEEEFVKNEQTYLRKSLSREGKTPEIYLNTASGSVKLKK